MSGSGSWSYDLVSTELSARFSKCPFENILYWPQESTVFNEETGQPISTKDNFGNLWYLHDSDTFASQYYTNYEPITSS